MALTGFQRALLRVLARNRLPNSVFAGGATLNRGRARWSDDFDIEHTTADAVRAAFLADRDTLAANGYAGEELRLAKGIAHARVSADGGDTLIDWTQDTAWRFFPAIADREFGWRLHDLDLSVHPAVRAGLGGMRKGPGPDAVADPGRVRAQQPLRPERTAGGRRHLGPIDPAAMTTAIRMADRPEDRFAYRDRAGRRECQT